jgi:hypothetical protein
MVIVPEYPSNSHTSREKPEPEEKKVEKVVVGGVTRRKPSLGRRFKDTFFAGDGQSVGRYIVTDILIPTLKDLLVDIITQGTEKGVYGDTRSAIRRSAAARLGNTVQTAYNRAYTTTPRVDPRVGPGPRQVRSTQAFDEYFLDTRAEAEMVIDQLVRLIGTYEQASVADLKDLLGETSVPYTDDRWGWNEISGMGVDYVRGAYLLRLPQPIVLKKA